MLGIAIEDKYDVTLPDGIEIRPSGDEELDVWLNVMADAVAVPDTQGVPWREEFPRDTYIEAERATAGCDVGVITTQPASKSQQNAQRTGFDLLYTRAVLVKHLTPS